MPLNAGFDRMHVCELVRDLFTLNDVLNLLPLWQLELNGE